MSNLSINLVEHLKYFGVFVGTFVEGPVVGLFSGFLVKGGFLKLIPTYLAYVIGDLLADIFYFSLGYQGRKAILKKFTFSQSTLIKAKKMQRAFHKHPNKILFFGKLTHILGLPILISAGMAHYSWERFLIFNFLATLIKSTILLFLGYYLADSWSKATNFFDYLGSVGLVIILVFIFYFLTRFVYKKWL